MALTSFGQDFRAANRVTARQLDALDALSGIGTHGRVEHSADETELIALVLGMGARTWHSLVKRGLADEGGLTGHGADVLAAHL